MRFSISLALMAASATASDGETTAPARFETGVETQVLTLMEAAQLLRVRPEVLEASAQQGDVPGRKIGRSWRFHRPALLRWLAGTEEFPVSTDEPAIDELAALRGRGPEAVATETEEDGSEEEGHENAHTEGRTIGEAPIGSTAEEVFLRERLVLLRRGELTIEPRVSYSIREETDIDITEFRGFDDMGVETIVLFPGLSSLEQDTTNASLALRYGIFDETELFARFRYIHQEIDADNIEREANDDLSGFFVGARRTLLNERASIPAVVLSLRGYLPIDDSSYSIGTTLTAVKSFDPIAVFAGFQYRHTFSRDFDRATLLEAEDTWGITLGYSFAVNDGLLLSTAISAAFASETEFSLGTLQSEEDYALRFGLTRLFRPGFYLEPSVTIGLTGPNQVTFGLSMPFTLIR